MWDLALAVNEALRLNQDMKLQQDTQMQHDKPGITNDFPRLQGAQMNHTAQGIALPSGHPNHPAQWSQSIPGSTYLPYSTTLPSILYEIEVIRKDAAALQEGIIDGFRSVRAEIAKLRQEVVDLAAQLGIEPKA